MYPGALKIQKFSGEGPHQEDPPGGPPQTPPVGGGRPPSHAYPDLALCAKMAAPPSLFPAIDTFVPATSNVNKNPDYFIELIL